MIGDFRAVGSLERFAVNLFKRILKRMLIHFIRHVLVVTDSNKAFNEFKFLLNKLVIVYLIDGEFSTAFVVHASNHSIFNTFW